MRSSSSTLEVVMQALPIFVSTGTLVPPTPSIKIPRLLKAPLYIPHWLGVGPSPDRFIADSAYRPLKELHDCWVIPLEWLGLKNRHNSVAAAKVKLRQMLAQYPGSKVILVGQSQGGLVVAELALDPEFAGRIAAVVFVGVPFGGSPAIDSRWLSWAAHVFPGVAAMQCGHYSLDSLVERLASAFPVGVTAVVVGSPQDGLVPEESAHAVRFPEGTEVQRYIIADECPERSLLEEEWRYIKCSRGLVHARMCRGSLVEVVKELRHELPRPVITELPLAA